jgi:hypothetical protein
MQYATTTPPSRSSCSTTLKAAERDIWVRRGALKLYWMNFNDVHLASTSSRRCVTLAWSLQTRRGNPRAKTAWPP